MDRDSFNRWIDLYEQAWRAEGTELLRDLFATDATYRTAPYEKPFRGLDAIAEMWDEERDSPHEAFEMSHEIVAVEGNTGVAFVEVLYGGPVTREYRDLWIVRFDRDGRCVAFEEWPFWPPGRNGGWIDGPKE
ncbi:MAG: nuclear transport factor 2 family protein [Actinobacteria bacterium]|nr:nuclear transport factor 2 family protein [Actinomycetota bacterium]